MPDREKVISEFEDFVKSFSKRDDTYYKGLFVSVLALLKEQEHKDRMFHALEDDWKRLKELLKEQEAVVRCKDCINIKKLPIDNHGHQPYWCENLNIYSEGLDWFCADGERQEGR